MAGSSDRDLGLGRAIPRRDFINGMAAAAGAAGLPGCGRDDAIEAAPGYYPPALTGLRGSTDASFADAHALRDRDFWRRAGLPVSTGETYDLVVVGAGISGLTAAHAFRKSAGAGTRILILDNHDDFGGHARRNEVEVGGRTLIGWGGSYAIDSPAPYSVAAKALIAELGVDVGRWKQVADDTVYTSRGLGRAIFFDRETFGADVLARFDAGRAVPGSAVTEAASEAMWSAFLGAAPLAEAAKQDLQHLYAGREDFLPGLTSDEKKRRLAAISYRSYLLDVAKVHGDVARLFQARAHSLFGVGMDAVPAQDAWGLDMPGFQGLGLEPGNGPGMNHDARRHPEGGSAYFFHYPDGNASIAGLLVRRLVDDAIPGMSADDIATARCDYARLDRAPSPVRIRLNSTVVRVVHAGDPAKAREVEVAYVRGGRVRSVKAGRCILACWHTMIPYVCPELPEAQRHDLLYAIKVPILYTTVVLRSWQAFAAAGVRSIHSPGGFHSSIGLAPPVTIGAYRRSERPEEPVVVHLTRTPCAPGLTAREQHVAGRAELLATPFAQLERATRDQLARALGPSGLDPARDIAAISINRWAHGYAYQYNSLFDRFWLEGGETPCERARRPFGRLAIANADALAYSYADAAIDSGLAAAETVARLR